MILEQLLLRVWLKSNWRHLLFWLLYCSLHLLVNQIMLGFSRIEPADRVAYYVSLIAIFYTMSYGVLPRFYRPGKYFWLGLSIVLLWVIFVFIQYVIDYTLHIYLAPDGPIPPEITLVAILAIPSCILLQCSILALGFWYGRNLNQKENEKNQAKNEALSVELTFLKSQFDIHFLFNVLNYFYAKSYKVSNELTEGILKLSEILKYSFKDDTNRPCDKVCLSEEIYYIQNLIEIYQMLFSNTLHIDLKTQGNLDQKQILPLVLISFVENAFKHGNLTEERYPLQIHVKAENETIDFFIRNRSGITRHELSNGIGLSNVKRRLALTYANRHKLAIEKENEFYSCRLTIYE